VKTLLAGFSHTSRTRRRLPSSLFLTAYRYQVRETSKQEAGYFRGQLKNEYARRRRKFSPGVR